MKKYSSGSFIDAAVRVYGSETDTISSFPATIIADGGNITPWTIYGNTSGGLSVGERTANLFDGNYEFAYMAGTNAEYYTNIGDVRTAVIACTPNTKYSIKRFEGGNRLRVATYTTKPVNNTTGTLLFDSNSETSVTITTPSDAVYLAVYVVSGATSGTIISTSIVTGETIPETYEPYGYKLPVVIGSTTTNIYMADVLRMSSGADPVYDVMSSNGVITRNVDTDGSPLPTPTTESFTAPTLATLAGSQSFTIDTTVKPSSVSLTYTGWHTHSDKQYSGGQWGQVSTNAKKKKSVLGSRKASKGKT